MLILLPIPCRSADPCLLQIISHAVLRGTASAIFFLLDHLTQRLLILCEFSTYHDKLWRTDRKHLAPHIAPV